MGAAHAAVWPAVVALFVKAGDGLMAAHAAGLLHHDFKPDNVMIGRGDVPRITDFGLAGELDDELADSEPGARPGAALSQLTTTGNIAGTPAYMAPEQLLGHPGGPRADQFSFCVSLFEVLYGARPFQPAAAPSGDLLDEIRAGRIVKPAAARKVPKWLHAAIVRGLAFDLEQRWGSMRALVETLERGRRRRRLRGAIGVVAALGIAVAAGGLVAAHAHAAPARCADVAPKANDAATILICRDEYVRTNDPQVGTELANALRRTGKLRDAATVATELLATSAQADAMYTLGKIAVDDGRRDDAERALRHASALHRAQQRWADSATDLQALAGVSNDFVDQLVGFDAAIHDARRGHDPRIEAYCHLYAADVLSKIAARAGALAELDRAQPLLAAPADLLQLELERGNVYQNLGDNTLAAAAFVRARVRAEAVPSARFARSARLNLVYSLAESGQLAAATRELAAAAALDPDDRQLAIRLALEARIALRSRDLTRAAGAIDRAIAATDRGATDDLLDLDVERAEISLARGELASAEQSARAAIGRIEALRSPHAPVELRSWMITDWRAPYELLFLALARRGDAAGALAVFDRYRGLDVLAGLVHGEPGGSGSPAEAGLGFPIAELARALPLLQTTGLATPVPERALRQAVHAASLLVLVVAQDELWRITAEAGRLEVQPLGRMAELRPRLEQFRTAPGDRAVASALGELLVPAQLARPSDQVLHVVLDAPLAWLPVAALRVGGRRVITARPIIRAVRPSDLGCVASAHDPAHVVTIDGDGEPAGQSGAARAALFGAARGDLLHVRAAIERDALGDALVLHDVRVRAFEIAGHAGIAGRVVLAGPAAGSSLAMAFVAAGADQVIAAADPVPRAAAEQLAAQLVQSKVPDLARALARLQSAEEPSGANDAWLGYAAFGRATCTPSPE